MEQLASLTTLAWLCMSAYALHVLEEFQMGWRDWARRVLKLPVEWSDFYVTNAVVIAIGIAQAQLAAVLPVIALVFASLMLINAVFFHILPTIRTRIYSPGTVTALVLFLPLGVATFRAAVRNGDADIRTCLIALGGGVVLMAYPVVMLKIRIHGFRDETNI